MIFVLGFSTTSIPRLKNLVRSIILAYSSSSSINWHRYRCIFDCYKLKCELDTTLSVYFSLFCMVRRVADGGVICNKTSNDVG